jgi:hypothetical protein
VAGQPHRDSFGDSRSDEVADRSAAEVVGDAAAKRHSTATWFVQSLSMSAGRRSTPSVLKLTVCTFMIWPCLVLSLFGWSQVSAPRPGPSQEESGYRFFLPMLATPGGLRSDWAFEFHGVRPADNDRCRFAYDDVALMGQCLHRSLTGTLYYP